MHLINQITAQDYGRCSHFECGSAWRGKEFFTIILLKFTLTFADVCLLHCRLVVLYRLVCHSLVAKSQESAAFLTFSTGWYGSKTILLLSEVESCEVESAVPDPRLAGVFDV